VVQQINFNDPLFKAGETGPSQDQIQALQKQARRAAESVGPFGSVF
jgi:hypothetical protein